MQIAAKEGGDKAILIAASLLHDIENLPKNHPRAHLSSQISEQTGICFKQNLRFTQNIWSLSSRL
jgi:HD superfamily phosphodiesterase